MSIDVTITFSDEQLESLRRWQQVKTRLPAPAWAHPDFLWLNAMTGVVLPAPRYIPKPGDLVRVTAGGQLHSVRSGERVLKVTDTKVVTAWACVPDGVNHDVYPIDEFEFERVPE